MTELTQSRLKELLHYDVDTGVFTWIKINQTRRINSVAGYKRKDSYVTIGVCKKQYLAHRLAWMYCYGEFPKIELDHKDSNPSNNAIDNLRLATGSQNQFNKELSKNNTTGFKGVVRRGKKFGAEAKIQGIRYRFYCYETAEEASTVYQAFIKQKHGEFYKRT